MISNNSFHPTAFVVEVSKELDLLFVIAQLVKDINFLLLRGSSK
jgi:hypothetical protein